MGPFFCASSGELATMCAWKRGSAGTNIIINCFGALDLIVRILKGAFLGQFVQNIFYLALFYCGTLASLYNCNSQFVKKRQYAFCSVTL